LALKYVFVRTEGEIARQFVGH